MVKQSEKIISISCLPLPSYVQGGHVIFKPGERHPNRSGFQFFVMMFMVKGELYIAEDDTQYTVKAGEMFILQPMHHHYSWKPMDQTTEYYWIHFSVLGNYSQQHIAHKLSSVVHVPSLHYYTPDVTIYLSKHCQVTNMDSVLPLIKKIFKNSVEHAPVSFWRAQQLFIDLLQLVQIPCPEQSQAMILSSQVQRYLCDHFDEKITVTKLGRLFHVHPNSIIHSMKKVLGITPNAFLIQYRLEEAVKRLLSTSMSISDIADAVGYQNVYYFSSVFKQHYGISPLRYREKYANNDKRINHLINYQFDGSQQLLKEN
ncbi:helix-turn-helix domain-containing protein [Secundilactobacillus yichangensis]|uniref:helix-turn-helix domain-containing protein n=1 Tax=Secundilactobacillus yichangensis TaxID=2799580 RepID=UPI0019411775|nr:AraC family transcriptional regulator [Secundilactobacillus yichangensis]